MSPEAYLNTEEGMAKKGGQVPQIPAATQWAFVDEMPQA